MTESFVQIIIPMGLFALMFALGLTQTVADFSRVVTEPKAVLIGLFVQLLLVPVLGVLLVISFDLPLMIGVGLVALAACPGGTMSNVVVHVGKGDATLSIALTSLATVVSLVTLPLWMAFALSGLGGPPSAIEMPILETGAQLGLFTVLPVVIGMLVRRLRPGWAAWEPRITKASVAFILAAFLAMAVMDEDTQLENVGIALVPTVILLLGAAVIGFLVPFLSGVGRKGSATVSVETCLKNILLPMYLASNSFNNVDVALPSAIAALVVLKLGIGVMVLYRFVERTDASEVTP